MSDTVEAGRGPEETKGLQDALMTQSKRLRGLRDRRDQLRADLDETEQVIKVTVDEIRKLTENLAGESTAPSNGKRK